MDNSEFGRWLDGYYSGQKDGGASGFVFGFGVVLAVCSIVWGLLGVYGAVD